MPFDVVAARNAGFSDDDIRTHLDKSFDVKEALGAGFTLEQIGDAVKIKKPEVAPGPELPLPEVTEGAPVAPDLRGPTIGEAIFRQEAPAVTTQVDIPTPELPREIPVSPKLTPPPLVTAPAAETAVDIPIPQKPFIPELKFEETTLQKLVPSKETALGFAWGLSSNPINRTIVKLVAPPKEGETESEKNKRFDTLFEDVDRQIRGKAPIATKIGAATQEIIDIAMTGAVVNRLLKTPKAAKIIESIAPGKQKALRGGLVGVAFGTGKETAEQLDEGEINKAQIFFAGLKDGLLFALVDWGFHSIANKLKAGKTLTREEGEIATRALNEAESNMLLLEKPLGFGETKGPRGFIMTQNKMREVFSPKTGTSHWVEAGKPVPKNLGKPLQGRPVEVRAARPGEEVRFKEDAKQLSDYVIENTPPAARETGKKTAIDNLEGLVKGKPDPKQGSKITSDNIGTGPIPEGNLPKDPEFAFNIRLKKFAKQAQGEIRKTVENDLAELQSLRGELRYDKIRKMAKSGKYDGLGIIADGESEAQIAFVDAANVRLNEKASYLNTLREQGLSGTESVKELSGEVNELVRTVSTWRAHAGRMLRLFRESAGQTEFAGKSYNRFRDEVIRSAGKFGKNSDDVLKELEGLDLTDPTAIAQFGNKYKTIKDKLGSAIEEYRYINMLSSPKTHIINFFTNFLQTLSPIATKTMLAAQDVALSAFTGAERKYFFREASDYFSGIVTSSFDGNAFRAFGRGFRRGGRGKIELTGLLTERASLPRVLIESPLRLLEGSDSFFRELIQTGERRALETANALGKKAWSPQQIAEKAYNRALYQVFRQKLYPEGQGTLLNLMDDVTNAVMKARNAPLGVGTAIRFLVPFIQTPTNILKQGIEYTPLVGHITAIGAKEPAEQFAKANIGSLISLATGVLAYQGNVTWDTPGDPKTNDGRKLNRLFYASGRRKYSLKIGNEWVSYRYLGPFAYPMMFAAAAKHHMERVVGDKKAEKLVTEAIPNIMLSVFTFLGDIPYMQGFGDVVDAVRGDERAKSKILSAPVRQLVPATAFQGWLDRAFDEYQRAPEEWGDFVKQSMPLLQGLVGKPPPLGATPVAGGEVIPVERTGQAKSSILPTSFSVIDPRFEGSYNNTHRQYLRNLDQKKLLRKQRRQLLRRKAREF